MVTLSPSESAGLHIDLDGAASQAASALGVRTLNARGWGPRLRMLARPGDIEAFSEFIRPHIGPVRFTLFGSGDFHHLTAVLMRRVIEPFTLVMFDNHPDWDIRPPRWSCGGWLNRALELPNVRRIIVLGCGNFELWYPARMFGRSDARLSVRPWAERLPGRVRGRYDCLSRDTLGQAIADLADELRGSSVYITTDLDALAAAECASNWEQGLFSWDQITSAIGQLRGAARVVGGDICGAYSLPVFERRLQRLAHRWDHPRLVLPDAPTREARNTHAMTAIWRSLTGS